jgi:threonylcarbamoyladenosine tRNA methylthiotransferase MtaB
MIPGDQPRRTRVAFATLGCKANQYESGRMAADFAARGCDVVEDARSADIVVVNTCTVTNTADGKSRREIRKLRRRNPDALVVATGCAAEMDKAGVGAATQAHLVVSNREKAALVASTLALGRRSPNPLPTLDEDAVPANVAGCRLPSLGRTRALLMVQDGCGYRCSYCIIPTARPLRVSRAFDELVAEAESLVGDGYREIVLTGISVGSWRDGSHRLHHLLHRLAGISGLERIRLSSIEPKTLTAPLVEAFRDLPQACHHFHVPLQAGDDNTLRSMNRYYDTAFFARLVARIRRCMPEAAISTDVITGFPTETDGAFERTLRFCREMDFCKIHVFPFSARAGTPAAALPDSVGPALRRERTARLIALSEEATQRWAERTVGQTVPVLAEPRDPVSGQHSGLTGNYVRVVWPSAVDCHGKLVPVRVTEVKGGEARGEAT